MSPDPYRATTGSVNNPANPSSWNRYVYVLGDPVNGADPDGTKTCTWDPEWGYTCIGGGSGSQPGSPPPQLPCVAGPNGTITAQACGGGAPRSPGIQLATSDLAQIGNGAFRGNSKCNDFFAALIEENDLDIDVGTLESQVMGTATAAGLYVYDGPSSGTELTPDKFPGIASPGVDTVGAWFAANPGAAALSQFNGYAIWIVASDWTSALGGLVPSSFAGQYGLGTMMHELLHKQSVGGGFTHDQLSAALQAIGMSPGDYALGHNAISDQLGRICF